MVAQQARSEPTADVPVSALRQALPRDRTHLPLPAPVVSSQAELTVIDPYLTLIYPLTDPNLPLTYP